MILAYKDNDLIMHDFDKCSLFEKSPIDDIFIIDSIFDHYPDMLSLICNSLNPSATIFTERSFSFEFCKSLFELFQSSNLTIEQKCSLIEVLDTIIINNLVEKDSFIFNLVFSLISIAEESSKLSDFIYKCMLDLICPEIINIFPEGFYDIINSTKNKYFICQIAKKISENLRPRNKLMQKPFILFLLDISELLDENTAFLIYTAHLNIYYLYPNMFPLLDIDFYTNAIKFDIDTQTTILNLLSCIKKCFEVFKNPQIQKLIFFGLTNSVSTSMMIQSIRALSNLLEADIEMFKEIYNEEAFFQQLISQLNYLILESSFDIKSDASYLLSLLLSNFPQILFHNICGNFEIDEICDIRTSISLIFDISQVSITLELLYGLESIFLFSLQENAFNLFHFKICEYEILDKINDLTNNDNNGIAETAKIIFTEIIEKIDKDK